MMENSVGPWATSEHSYNEPVDGKKCWRWLLARETYYGRKFLILFDYINYHKFARERGGKKSWLRMKRGECGREIEWARVALEKKVHPSLRGEWVKPKEDEASSLWSLTKLVILFTHPTWALWPPQNFARYLHTSIRLASVCSSWREGKRTETKKEEEETTKSSQKKVSSMEVKFELENNVLITSSEYVLHNSYKLVFFMCSCQNTSRYLKFTSWTWREWVSERERTRH